jgi:hypothetical protein
MAFSLKGLQRCGKKTKSQYELLKVYKKNEQNRWFAGIEANPDRL